MATLDIIKEATRILNTPVSVSTTDLEVENTKHFLDMILSKNDIDEIEYRRLIRKIWFEFKCEDTNLVLLNNLETAYESAFTAKRLYAFGCKVEFLKRYEEFKGMINSIVQILTITWVDRMSLIEILEDELNRKTDRKYTLNTLFTIVKELSWVARHT